MRAECSDDGLHAVVAGDSGIYTVRLGASGWECECRAAYFRRRCSHVRAVQLVTGAGREAAIGQALTALVAEHARRLRSPGTNRVRREWAALMLARDLHVYASVIAGRPVLARQLDAVALRRALRGAPLPAPGEYIVVTETMLDAIAEGGPFELVGMR